MSAVEALSSEFDYFAPLVLCDHLSESYCVSVAPKTALDRKHPLEFTIAGEEGVYRDLNNSLFQVKCKVTKSDGTDLPAGAAVAPVNLLLHALIKSCEISVGVNGKRISEPSSNYAERAYLETILSTDERVLNTRGVIEGWAKDDAEQMNSLVLTANGGNHPNNGFVTRSRWCARSRVMTLCGRLHADLFHQPLDIPAGVPINVKLDLNSDKKVLMAAVDGNFELKLISAKLLVQSKKLKPDLVYAHQKMAMKSNYKIPYIKVTVKENLLTPNSTSLALNNFHTGRMPNRITLCMVATSAHNGEYNENPFNFRNFGLTDLQLTVGSRTIPHEPLKMNYTLGDYAEAYLSTLASLGIDQGDRAISLTPEEWATAYNVYTFKLAAGDISTGVLNSSTATSVDITVNGTFANPLPAHVTVLSYIEHSDVLEIDHLRNVV